MWRHLPLDEVHPYARRAAQAAEAAAAQDGFWNIHDRLLTADDLDDEGLVEIARAAGLDVSRFTVDLNTAVVAAQVDADVRSAHDSGADGTPPFFLNGVRVDGPLDEVIAAAEQALEVVQA